MPEIRDCVDLQLNGYLGHDFNGDRLADDALHAICERLAEEGVARFLPTVITDELPTMQRRLARLVELRSGDLLAEEMRRREEVATREAVQSENSQEPVRR